MALNALGGLGLAKPITTMITMMMQKKPAVLYHYPCPDRAFAALAAHLFFSAAYLLVMFFPNTVYNPIASNQLPLPEISNIYLLDIVDPSGFVQEISSKVSRVVVADHRKTAVEGLCGESSCSVGENVERVLISGGVELLLLLIISRKELVVV